MRVTAGTTYVLVNWHANILKDDEPNSAPYRAERERLH